MELVKLPVQFLHMMQVQRPEVEILREPRFMKHI
jgi:hypothetical protein